MRLLSVLLLVVTSFVTNGQRIFWLPSPFNSFNLVVVSNQHDRLPLLDSSMMNFQGDDLVPEDRVGSIFDSLLGFFRGNKKFITSIRTTTTYVAVTVPDVKLVPCFTRTMFPPGPLAFCKRRKRQKAHHTSSKVKMMNLNDLPIGHQSPMPHIDPSLTNDVRGIRRPLVRQTRRLVMFDTEVDDEGDDPQYREETKLIVTTSTVTAYDFRTITSTNIVGTAGEKMFCVPIDSLVC